MTEPDFIDARLPPPANSWWVRLKQWSIAIVVVGLGVLFAYKAFENWKLNQALGADNVIKVLGLAFSVHDIEVRPVGNIFAIRAELRPLDLSSNRPISLSGLMNGACSALLESDLINVDARSVFRVTINLEDPDERVWGGAPVDVTDAQCRVHTIGEKVLYTMPAPLNGWVLKNWTARVNASSADQVMNVIFAPRVDADPDVAAFDHLFACRVLMADWPETLPREVAGRMVNNISIEARLGVSGTLLSFGRFTAETFSLRDGDCVEEAI